MITELPRRITDRIGFDGPVPADPSEPLSTGCWIWMGGRFPAGYGSVWIDGKNRLLHQVVYEAVIGETSDRAHYLDHLCRVRFCCNPAHLRLGTPLDNMISAQRDHCVNGHAYDEANTARTGRTPNQCVCRACSREKTARYRERKAAA